MGAQEEIRQTIAEAIDSFAPISHHPEAENIMRALTAAGYAIVPREPTPAMMDAGRCAVYDVWSSRGIKDCYKAMLAASEGKG